MFAVRALPVLALALSAFAGSSSSSSQCNTGSVTCCVSNYAPDSYEASVLTHALGLDAASLPAGNIAATCGGGDVNVGGGSTCENIPMCCEGNNFGGVIGIGCTVIPVSV